MGLKGKGIRAFVRRSVTGMVKTFTPAGIFYNAPRKVSTAKAYINADTSGSHDIIPVYDGMVRTETPPEIFNYRVSGRFQRYYQRKIPDAYVVRLKAGMSYGAETNYIITPSNELLSDVSREFGMYGGKPMAKSNLLRQTLKLPKAKKIRGKVAVITTSGANNFHHWNYDCLPRLHLLKQAGLIDQIDHFLISFKGLPFQKESLSLFGIPDDKIYNPSEDETQLFQADALFVPSLPSHLGTVSPWVVEFLRSLYNPSNEKVSGFKRVYLSRKKVSTRKIINNEQFISLLNEFGVREVFPEDYTVQELAHILAGADFIISIHGSGLSNLCFVSDSTTVIDILAPFHQDCYYWMLSNIRNSKYIGFFAQGEHPPDDADLVKRKIDDDLQLDLSEMRVLLSREIAIT